MADSTRRVTFRDVFGVREFRWLWFAELMSIAGDQLARVALSILVYNDTGSAALTGLTYALTFAPSILGGILLSGLADRFPRRDVMMVVDLLRAGLIALVMIPMPFWAMCVLVGSVSFLNPLFKSSQVSLLPDILEGDRFTVGMAIRSMTIQSAQVLGFFGGGLLLITVDPRLALGLDALTFLASALFIRFGLQKRAAASAGADRPPFLKSMGQGGRLIFADPALRVLLLFTWLAGLIPVYEGIAAPYADLAGNGNSAALGLLLAADPVGSVIGAAVYTKWVPARARPKLPGVLTVLTAVPLLFCLLEPGLLSSVVLFAVCGGLGSVALMQATVTYTLKVPDERRGQAISLSNTGLTTIMGLSPLAGGLLADQIGAYNAVAVFGGIGLALAIPLALAWRRIVNQDTDRWIPSEDKETSEAAT